MKFYFMETGEERPYRYTPEHKVRELTGPLFINISGLSLQALNVANNRK